MKDSRITRLRRRLKRPQLIKKKENLLYLTGRSFMHGFLLVKPFHGSLSRRRGRAGEGVVFFGDGLEKVDGIGTVDHLQNIGRYVSGKRLEVEYDLTYGEGKYIEYKNPGLTVVPVAGEADRMRQVKEAGELRFIRASMEIVAEVFARVKAQLGKRPWREAELAAFIAAAGKELGAEDISFPPIVAAGSHAAVPHHVPDNTRIRPGESVILDFGFKFRGYCSDFTRTVFLASVPDKLAAMYRQTELAYLRSVAASKTGAKASDVFRVAMDTLEERKLGRRFIHSLGHGTGLEIHEQPNLAPTSKDTLRDGMVFSIEPGVYVPKFGGIRIEDLVHMKQGKARRFIEVPTDLESNTITPKY